jgi:hypothetical protein
MANKLTVGELVYKISGDMENLKTELKKSQAEITKLQSSMEKSTNSAGNMSKSFSSLATGIKAFITGAIVKGIVDIAKAGAEFDSLSQSFNRLTATAGMSSNEVLNKMRELSVGTIADSDLILSANRAMTLGVAKNTDEFSQLMQIARLKARDMGLSTTQAFNDIVTGIGRASPMILDNLGIIIKQEAAQQKYAASLGKTAKELTLNEQKEALKFAVLRDGMAEVEQAGELTLTYAERIQQVTVAATNLKNNLGRAMLPAMESVLGLVDLQNLSTEEMAQRWTEISETIYRVINTFIWMGNVIKASVEVITGFIMILYKLSKAFVLLHKDAFNSISNIKENLSNLGEGVVKLFKGDISGALGSFKKIIKDNFKDSQDAFEDLSYTAQGVVKTLQQTVDGANKYLDRAINATDFTSPFEGAADDLTNAFEALKESLPDAGDTAEAKKELEALQEKIYSIVDASKKASVELDTKLGDAFKKFSDNIKENISDTVSGLADLVVGAEDKIKEINKELWAPTTTQDRQEELRKELSEQEGIISARADFEERQSERIAAIREKFASAGIDAEQAGLGDLLQIRSLEDEIEEKKRVASLDEFTRFEEQQAQKLVILTDNFLTEIKLLQDKSTLQKQYEEDITSFLIGENAKRIKDTDKWASETISKYGEISKSLENLLSTQQKLNSLSPASMLSQTPTIPVESENKTPVSQNTTTISAPVNINGQNVQNLTAQEISSILGFELKRYIK